MSLNLNLGCGEEKLEGFVNVDANAALNPDVCANFVEGLPYEDNTVDKIYLFHTIEHLPKSIHPKVLGHITRVLKPGGLFFVSYPEFSKVVQYWLDNHRGMRDFWEKTIYGRQSSQFDFHVTAMHTPYFINLLQSFGFEVSHAPEGQEDYNTVCKCVKTGKPVTIESIYNKAWFNADKTPDGELCQK